MDSPSPTSTLMAAREVAVVDEAAGATPYRYKDRAKSSEAIEN